MRNTRILQYHYPLHIGRFPRYFISIAILNLKGNKTNSEQVQNFLRDNVVFPATFADYFIKFLGKRLSRATVRALHTNRADSPDFDISRINVAAFLHSSAFFSFIPHRQFLISQGRLFVSPSFLQFLNFSDNVLSIIFFRYQVRAATVWALLWVFLQYFFSTVGAFHF
jgi:hypothetical protein